MAPTTDVLMEYGPARLPGLEALDHEADVAAAGPLLAALLPAPEDVPRPRRNCGLAGRGHAHLKDASTMIFEEWEKMTREALVHCWVKSTVLPVSMAASLVSEHAEYRQGFASVAEDVQEVLTLLRGTSLGREVVGGESEHDAREGVRLWLGAEDEEDAIVDTADLMIFPTSDASGDDEEAPLEED